MERKLIDTERRSTGEQARTFVVNICIAFTVMMVGCMICGTIFADEQARAGILYCWSILGACLIAGVLQFVFFTPVLIKRLSYAPRVALFGICFYAALVPIALVLNWFPAEFAGAWVGFTCIYLVLLALFTLIFSLVYRQKIRSLNEGLSRFKESQNRLR